jgi:hypothetical protein
VGFVLILLSVGRWFPLIVGIQTARATEKQVVLLVGALVAWDGWETTGVTGVEGVLSAGVYTAGCHLVVPIV